MSLSENNSMSKLDVLEDVVVGDFLEEPFQNILNFRDVGKTINKFLGEKRVAEGLLFRSARPDDATLQDRKRLQEEYGIKTIMDLRTVTEHKKQKAKRSTDLKTPQLVLANPALAEPMKIPGLNYLPININGKGFEHNLLWQLSFWSFLKLIFYMIIGQRMKGIHILGSEVMEPRGLIGLGYDTLDFCGEEIADALRALASPKTPPILIHCTQGKDRTGIIIALALLLLDMPVEAITHDYLLSVEGLVSERESRLREIREIGLGEEFAGCPEGWVDAMERYVGSKYGGVRAYGRKIGFGDGEVERLVGVLGV